MEADPLREIENGELKMENGAEFEYETGPAKPQFVNWFCGQAGFAKALAHVSSARG